VAGIIPRTPPPSMLSILSIFFFVLPPAEVFASVGIPGASFSRVIFEVEPFAMSDTAIAACTLVRT